MKSIQIVKEKNIYTEDNNYELKSALTRKKEDNIKNQLSL